MAGTQRSTLSARRPIRRSDAAASGHDADAGSFSCDGCDDPAVYVVLALQLTALRCPKIMYTVSQDVLNRKLVNVLIHVPMVATEMGFDALAESSDFASPAIMLAVSSISTLTALTTTS